MSGAAGLAAIIPGVFERRAGGARQPDDLDAARSGEAGCRAGRKPKQTPSERAAILERAALSSRDPTFVRSSAREPSR